MSEQWDRPARDALIRMSVAVKAGRGVRISWNELEVMERTFIGQAWADILNEDEKTSKTPYSKATK